jgi:prepilin-type N-terminal cleavage/methylation domain-containing protein
MSRRRAFTLIELLVVIVVIGMLASIAIPKFANSKQKTALAAMKSDLRNLVTAEQSYFSDWGTYTATLSTSSYRTTTGVTLGTITVTTGGYSASATFPGATAFRCEITVGGAAADGEVTCAP